MFLYTLIHVFEGEQSTHNNFTISLNDQVSLYLKCAKQLATSLEKLGIKLTVLTNNKSYLLSLIPEDVFSIIQLNFFEQVPHGINFFSAHYKFEVFKYLSELNLDYVGLIDPDMVCISEVPASLRKAIDDKIPLYYDITAQVTAAYGIQTILKSKQQLYEKSVGLWAGGEFITGSPAFFGRLYRELSLIKNTYFNNYTKFHHQGDEMVTSVVIEKLKQEEKIDDAGNLLIVGRFWSVKPKHLQHPIDAYAKHFLLHLPSDKRFIAANTDKQHTFLKRYKNYLHKKKIFRQIFSPFFPLIKSTLKKLKTVF